MKVQRTRIVKVRLTAKDMEQLDSLKCELAEEIRRDVPLTAVVRAATRVGIAGPAQRPAIAEQLRADTVRRGRGKGEARSAGLHESGAPGRLQNDREHLGETSS